VNLFQRLIAIENAIQSLVAALSCARVGSGLIDHFRFIAAQFKESNLSPHIDREEGSSTLMAISVEVCEAEVKAGLISAKRSVSVIDSGSASPYHRFGLRRHRVPEFELFDGLVEPPGVVCVLRFKRLQLD
jgi:hypothetical protein